MKAEIKPPIRWTTLAIAVLFGALLGILGFVIEHARELFALAVGAAL